MSWFKEAIIYHILIDRFAKPQTNLESNGATFCGGNFQGIIEHVDHLKELGINTVWLSPFQKGVAYHGYHITDFFKVDSSFGTEEDLKELIATLHKNNIKIIMDFVPNHCSNRHPYFLEAQQNKESEYRKWFYFKRNNDYLKFLHYPQLVKFNLDYLPAREHIIKAAKFWLDKGIDGLRLDHATGPSFDFWKAFAKEINESHPSAVLIGEVAIFNWKWSDYPTLKGVKNKVMRRLRKAPIQEYLKDFVGLLDGVLDFTFYSILQQFARKELNATQVRAQLEQHYKNFPDDFFLPVFLDNHDVSRYLFSCHQDKEQYKKAIDILFAQSQPKIIYYGDEIGMTQVIGFTDADHDADLLARQPMAWHLIDWDVLNYYKKKIKESKK